jgi:hypothetical protein
MTSSVICSRSRSGLFSDSSGIQTHSFEPRLVRENCQFLAQVASKEAVGARGPPNARLFAYDILRSFLRRVSLTKSTSASVRF